jgi:hypothetical protein
VYANAHEHNPKGKMILSSYHQLLQEIIIQDAVIAPLTGNLFTVNVLVQLCAFWNAGEDRAGAVLQSGRPALNERMPTGTGRASSMGWTDSWQRCGGKTEGWMGQTIALAQGSASYSSMSTVPMGR